MDGLTNIIAKINEQNDAECQAIVDAAKQKADAIISEAKKDAEMLSAKIIKNAEEKAAVINSKAVSSSDVEYKRVVLSKKSEIIEKIISDSLANLSCADDETYFGYIETLIKTNALSGKGTVKMSSKDISRLPDGFAEKVNSLLEDGKSISISKDNIETTGGFVIEYPEIRVDCTFASLINDKNDEIRDEINKILFS